MDHVAGVNGNDVDESFGREEDYYKDDDSDSEYVSIQRPAFYVSREPNFDSGPAQDGLEYLRWETEHIQKVKVAKMDGKLGSFQVLFLYSLTTVIIHAIRFVKC